jgi:hypothetical protein
MTDDDADLEKWLEARGIHAAPPDDPIYQSGPVIRVPNDPLRCPGSNTVVDYHDKALRHLRPPSLRSSLRRRARGAGVLDL